MERDIIFDMAAFSFRQLFFDYCFSGYKSSPLGVGVWRPFLWCGCFWRLFRLLIFLSWIWWCSSPVHGKVYHLDIGGIFFLSFFSPAIFPPGCGCLAPLPVVWVFSTFFCYSFYENGAPHLFIRKVYHEGMAAFWRQSTIVGRWRMKTNVEKKRSSRILCRSEEHTPLLDDVLGLAGIL